MKIVIAQPPLIDKIDEVFHCKGQDVIYAWGDTIYNPAGWVIPDFLIAHEEVHGRRQGDNIEDWWHRYMLDIEFRYQEELHAHAKEFQVRSRKVKDRNKVSELLMWSAARLNAPLYGKMTNLQKAMKDIKALHVA
jgi:hypothetical protein